MEKIHLFCSLNGHDLTMKLKQHIYCMAVAAMTILGVSTRAEAAPRRHFEAIPGSYNHQITAIHQHSDGLLWIGTANGLCVYDGYNVIPAPTQHPDSVTFLNDHITKIREDSQGRLWIRAQSHYGIYDPKTQTEDGDLARIL